MYDPTIHARTLSRHLQAQDFATHPQLFQDAQKRAMLAQAVGYGCAGFPPTSLKRNTLRKKFVYGFTDIAEALVLRHISSNIRRVTSVKQSDRTTIVKCIRTLASEGVPFRVYKFDVSRFYESIDITSILHKLSSDIAFSGQSVRALASFFEQLRIAQIPGLPRGISLSATLAEYVMRDFDEGVRRLRGVWYYARFVDDIIVITDAREDVGAFCANCSSTLPTGLFFNQKSKHYTFSAFAKGNPPTPEGIFEFLGYRFIVSRAFRNKATNKIERSVAIDLAASKVRKLKTRIAKSLHAFNKGGSFVDLRDRLRIITSNVVYVDFKTKVRRTSGVRFNYPLLELAASQEISQLDHFMRLALTAPHAKNRLYPTGLTTAQRRELAGLTFKDGFAKKRFFNIPKDRLIQLSSVWLYV